MKSNRSLLGRLRETTRITPRRQTHLFWVILCRTMSVQVYKRTISVWKMPSTDAFSFFFLYVCNLFTATCWTNAMQPLKLTVLQSETKQKRKSKCWSGISVWSCNTTLLLNPALVYSADNKRIHILESVQIITETLRMMICHIWQQLRQIKRLPLCFSSKGWKYETANSRNLKLDLIDFHYMIC